MIYAEPHTLEDDGVVPNNPRLPLLVYRSAVKMDPDAAPAKVFEDIFDAHGWRGAWVNGIYPFHHYHARSHEVLGLAVGYARVQFGGSLGPRLELRPGDAVVIPAGVGHCCHEAADLVVVGAYPAGQEAYDLKRATQEDRRQALREIPNVALPDQDPIAGKNGPLLQLWRWQ